MKKFLILSLLICLACNQAKADNVIIKGDTLWTIGVSPFDNYPGITTLREQLKDYGTHCTEDGCSFLSTWKIVNNRLMLAKIENCACNIKKQTANLKNLFGSRLENDMLEAYWYTGEIWVTKSQPNSWGGMFAASWPSETRLIVDKGVVVSVKNFVYPEPIENDYYKYTEPLNKFIYAHINWKRFHNLPQHSNGSYFSFDQDANGYLINLKYFDADLSGQTYDKEAMDEINRVAGLLQWPLFYHQGKPVKSFSGIVIVLSKEMRNRYPSGTTGVRSF